MKICFIVGAFPKMKCGVGDYTCNLAEELAKKGNVVHIITSKTASTDNKLLHIHNIVENWEWSDLKLIMKKIKEIKPDAVNVEYPSDEYKSAFMLSYLPYKIKKKLKCCTTATIHEYDYEEFSIQRKFRLYLNFSKLDKIIVAEEKFIEKIKQIVPKIEITYVPISSNIPKSKINEKDKQDLIKKYNLNDKQIVSYFGFARPSKGIEILLKAISRLDKDIELLYIGKLDEKNEYENTILDLIKELKLIDRIKITGLFDDEKDVADLLQISDICVLPFLEGVQTRNGSFLAAYNQEIPIITTSKELNDNEQLGIYYVKPNNEEELSNKIEKVLKNKKGLKRETLDWKRVAEKYIENFK